MQEFGRNSKHMKHYIKQNLIAFDQLVNTLLCGMADETLSARAYRMQEKGHKYWGWTASFINKLFFWQANHCRGAWRDEIERRQYPDSYQ